MGGMLSYMYTLLYPQEVENLICLDGCKPIYCTHADDLLRECVNQLMKKVNYSIIGAPPCYTWEELVIKVSKAFENSVQPEYCKYLLERNIVPSQTHKGKKI